MVDKFDNHQAITETYSVERPASVTGTAVYDQIINQSKKYGLNTNTALRIAKCESAFRQYNEDGGIIRGKVNPADVGVFQINEKYHLERSQTLGFDIYQTADNIEYAMWLMKKEGTRHWNWSRPCWGQENA